MGMTTEEQEKQRLEVLYEHCCFLFYPMNYKVLYIGAGPGKMQLVSTLRDAHLVYLLEAYHPNIESLMTEDAFDGYVEGDIRDILPGELKELCGDIHHIVWWHGPEHVAREDLRRTLHKLEKIAIDSVVLGCPYGVLEQDVVQGNEYERHLSHYYPGDFQNLGYETCTIGAMDSGVNSCIVSWKRIRTCPT